MACGKVKAVEYRFIGKNGKTVHRSGKPWNQKIKPEKTAAVVFVGIFREPFQCTPERNMIG
jgi:hypothetical protein